MKTKNVLLTLLATASLNVLTFAQESGKTPLTCSVSLTTPKCHGSSDGAIDLNISGGFPPYTVVWGNGSTGSHLTGIGAGTYDVIIADALHDTITGPVTVIEPAQIVVTGIVTDVSNLSMANGAIDVSVSGLLEAYSYSWGTVDGSGLNAGTLDQNGLKIGTYNLKVTSATGCIVEKSFRVNLSLMLNFQHIIQAPDQRIVYPNPSNGPVNFKNVNAEDKIEIFNEYGILVKTLQAQEPTDLPAGTYHINITKGDGSIQNETLIVR